MDNVIEVNGLTHRFGDKTALDGLTFSVRHGEILGLLGPNGAGKTTTIRLLNGLFNPTAGDLQVMGLDPRIDGHRIRQQTGVLTETPALYERLTAWQNLAFFGTLMGMTETEWRSRSQELLAFFDLEGRANDRIGTYSKGMKQRMALARALLNQPEMLFLDEPTAGLDPESSQQVHALIENIRGQNGRTVLLCTHNLFEAERLCDRLAIINRGRLLALGSLSELRQRLLPGHRLQVAFHAAPGEAVKALLATLPYTHLVHWQDDTLLRLEVENEAQVPELIAQLVSAGARLLSLQPQPVSLEEIYFALQSQDRERAE